MMATETLVFETPIGFIAVKRAGELLQSLTFGHTTEREALQALAHAPANSSADRASVEFTPAESAQVDFLYRGNDDLVDRLCAMAEGDVVNFDDVPIDDRYLTPFGRRVIAACRAIGWGETVTYGELAERAGQPGAARAVGSVMARNRVPLVVPCHRVVPASGGLGGFSAPQGVAMKRHLLDMEQRAAQVVS